MHGVAASRVEVVHGRTVGDEASEHGEMLALGDLSPLKQQFLEHKFCVTRAELLETRASREVTLRSAAACRWPTVWTVRCVWQCGEYTSLG
jgi:hypothetical protein